MTTATANIATADLTVGQEITVTIHNERQFNLTVFMVNESEPLPGFRQMVACHGPNGGTYCLWFDHNGETELCQSMKHRRVGWVVSIAD